MPLTTCAGPTERAVRSASETVTLGSSSSVVTHGSGDTPPLMSSALPPSTAPLSSSAAGWADPLAAALRHCTARCPMLQPASIVFVGMMGASSVTASPRDTTHCLLLLHANCGPSSSHTDVRPEAGAVTRRAPATSTDAGCSARSVQAATDIWPTVRAVAPSPMVVSFGSVSVWTPTSDDKLHSEFVHGQPTM